MGSRSGESFILFILILFSKDSMIIYLFSHFFKSLFGCHSSQLVFIFFENFYWRIGALQCCVSFCCIKSESAIHTHISPHFWICFLFR